MAVNWVDGVLGGTPITASNLNAMDLANPTSAAAIAASLTYEPKGLSAGTQAVIESRTFVIDTLYASLEGALAATPSGGVLEVRTAWTRATTFTVDRPVTVRFRGGSITTNADAIAAITVTSNGVRIEGAVLTGTSSATSSTGAGIVAVGSSPASPITGLRITRPTISSFTQHGIYLENCYDFRIEDINLSSIAYAGISLASCINGEVSGGSITNVTMPSPLTNAYGVAVSRKTNSAGELTTYPRSANISVRKVTVTNVPWEGLDTHGGTQIEFINNTVIGCMVGIALVPSSNNAGTSTYATLGCLVTGNKIFGNVTDGSLANGVQVVGSATEKATGLVNGNEIEDMGKDSSTVGLGGIYVEQSSGLVVAGNSIKRPGGAGLLIGPSNNGLGLFNNTVEDVWGTASAICSAVYVKTAGNSLVVSGTQIVRGAKTATLVNNEGIRCNTSSTQVDGGGNWWARATTPVVSGGSVLVASVYGAAPVARAAAITSPTAPSAAYVQAEAAAMKTAVDAIRVALQNYGITL